MTTWSDNLDGRNRMISISSPAGARNVVQNATETCRSNSVVHNPPAKATSVTALPPNIALRKSSPIILGLTCHTELLSASARCNRSPQLAKYAVKTNAAAKSRTVILVRQICRRSTGCESNNWKVPKLHSRPNESTASMIMPKKTKKGVQANDASGSFQNHGRKTTSGNAAIQLR